MSLGKGQHISLILLISLQVSTGPLGQGLTNAVGMAIAQAHMAAEYNKENFALLDSYTYVICGDGCLQEGITAEAASLAGHLGLGRLIVLYDDNKVTIDGHTDLSFTEDVLKRFEAYGWHVSSVEDGDHDVDGIENAINTAKAVTDRPSIIKVSTSIGFGSKKANTADVHGSPLGPEDLANVKKLFGFDPTQSYVVEDDVREYYSSAAEKARQKAIQWEETWNAYKAKYPEKAAEFDRRVKGELPAGWMDALPRGSPSDKAVATRTVSGNVLNALVPHFPEIMGGSADLTPSNMTALKNIGDFQKGQESGRYIRFGVREHAMAAISNGMAAFGGYVPYCATFLNFIGYALGAVRLSALSEFRVLYVATHDSIGLGEDGPTHQPVEMLESLRAMPNMYVYRPADINETSAAYALALLNPKAPAVFALSRQNLPQLEGSSIEAAMKGGYIVFDTEGDVNATPDLLIVATGSEVSLAIDAAKKLKDEGKRVQVISLMCTEEFEKQPMEYKQSVFKKGVPVVSVEASAIQGWEKYAHAHIGLTTFGLSCPGNVAYEKLGITVNAVVEKSKKVLDYYNASNPAHPVPAVGPSF